MTMALQATASPATSPPTSPPTSPGARAGAVSPAQLATVQRACRYIERQIAEGEGGAVTLAELGRHCRTSPWHLQRLFKQVTGVTPRQYGDARRLERLRAGLQQGDGVAAATYEAGFGSSSRVYERADAALGMTPATYARGGKGAEIAYASAPTPLGRLLVAATRRGVCFVSLGEADGPLEGALAAEFPAASRRRDPEALGAALDRLVAYLEGAAPPPDLPLDIRCTAFQRRVWEELRRIPLGETRSYREIAQSLGEPRAQRAVGRACASNPVALVVPCHRAVREDGGPSGYRWGGARKQALLALEQAEAAAAKR
jgi:AraC family transcriptional regulator of adaptative response/methylated-DNA-[protein]-cysteine methyltransferase